jgi:hypothetical protein
MLTRSKSKSADLKNNDEKEKADDLNVQNCEKIKINGRGRGRGRPKKILMQQIQEIEDNDEQDDKINENKELENEVNLSNCFSDVAGIECLLKMRMFIQLSISLLNIFA